MGFAVTLASTSFAWADDFSNGQWPMGGQNLDNSRSQRETNISAANVSKLQEKWVFTTQGDVTATPAVFGDAVYFPDFAGNYYALKAKTGDLIWTKKISDWTGQAGDYARDWTAVDGDSLFLGDQVGSLATWSAAGGLQGAGARVVSVNRHSGALNWATQVDSFAAALVTGSPVAYDGVLYVGVATAEESTAATAGYPCCASSGSVVALDEKSGKILWQTKMVPTGYSGGSIWGSTPVVDPRRRQLYVGTGNNFSAPQSVKDCFAANNSNPNCAASNDLFDAVVALDLKTGKINWSHRAMFYDTWNVACLYNGAGTGNCPKPEGPDYDFGGVGPNMLKVDGRDVIGIGEKSGIYWALNPDTGAVIWNTQVGPGSSLGGIEWGTAYDDKRVYVPISNLFGIPYALQPSGAKVNSGSWAALDPKTGKILWQTGTPGACSAASAGVTQGCMALGAASVANGVVFGGSMDVNPANPTMFALDASSGKILWSFNPGSSVLAGPAISGDTVYWGAGYRRLGPTIGTGNNKLFAFSVSGHDH